MSDKSMQHYRDQVVAVAVRQYTYRDHEFPETGSLATECKRCRLPHAYAITIARINWPGYPCGCEYSQEERAAIHRLWIEATR